MPRTLKVTPTESVTVRESTPDVLKVEGEYAPGSGEPPKHFHPSQDERFEVLAGALWVRIDGEERVLDRGQTLDIPRGAIHQMWNPGSEPARVIWQTRPRRRTEQWFEAIDSLHRQGRVDSKGMPGPLAFGVLLTEYRDVFRLAAGPDPIVRRVLALLGAIGRRRGYSALAR